LYSDGTKRTIASFNNEHAIGVPTMIVVPAVVDWVLEQVSLLHICDLS